MSTQRGRKSAASLTVVALAPLRRLPKAPADLSKAAAELWGGIVRSLPADFFRPCDLPLLRAYCIATDRKAQVDALIFEQGVMFDGEPHPGLKISRAEAALMASLAAKLRLCPSSRTRPDAAGLKTAHSGARPWDKEDDASKYFS